ncbi:MAG: S9 family peptidase [Geodermatophilaceae bacterium]|nr:S9 family peptidase [Geodermatophilaceae bacterium]
MTDHLRPPTHPFAALADYNAVPRLAGLALSPDGTRLVTSVATLNPEKTKWQSALWEVDPNGKDAARRLTRSAPGESSPVFAPTGELLFSSARPDPDAGKDADEPKAGLWLLPAQGGEARLVLSRPSGVSTVVVARDSSAVAVVAAMNPGATDGTSDAERSKARKDAGVTALLHEDYPVRYWDHDLGPAWPHVLYLADIPADGPAVDPTTDADMDGGNPDEHEQGHQQSRLEDHIEIRDLTPDAGLTSLGGEDLALSPDGTRIARTVEVAAATAGHRRTRIELVDTLSGASQVLAEGEDADFGQPAFSPDGAYLVCSREQHSSYDDPPDQTLWLIELATGQGRDLTPDLDLWPGSPVWTPDSAGVYFTASERGYHPAFRVELTSGAVTRLTSSGYYSDLLAAPDGSAVYAMRAAYDSPSLPVRLDPSRTDQDAVALPSPGTIERLPGTLHRIEATTEDGATIASWLVLPAGASSDSPAPLLLWIHGGPLMSWNAWSWRWCPWLMAARGYAVLLPDPALSDGYGQDFVRRGWGQWGGTPYTDLMRATDSALERTDLDPTRTAAMGGSFGGYMANWVATHTDRFDAIVTHASLWHLDGFSGATDASYYWEKEFGDPLTNPERYDTNSPHKFADNITTPMLVIHGDKDYRVPIGEGLRLWYDLRKRGIESKFLYFPDENHWVLTPGNAAVWYETVFAFLAEHVLGKPWARPELL